MQAFNFTTVLKSNLMQWMGHHIACVQEHRLSQTVGDDGTRSETKRTRLLYRCAACGETVRENPYNFPAECKGIQWPS